MPKITIMTEVAGLKNFETVLKEAMNDRIKFAKAKDKAEEGIKQANTKMMVFFKMLNLKDGKLHTKTTGNFTYMKPDSGKSFNKEKCKVFLAAKGVNIKIINDAFEDATEEIPRSEHMKWDKPKKKGDKK